MLYEYVVYHSSAWVNLVGGGWVTLEIFDNNVAKMVYVGKP